jgi:hypothetical protein
MPNASSISTVSAHAITLEVNGVVEPASAYFCEYEDEAALNIARMNTAEELEEMDRADGLIESYNGEDEDSD